MIKCHEICSKLAELLNLQSSEGFGLVLIMENDVIASYNDEYFMDFLYESTKHISSHDSGLFCVCMFMLHDFEIVWSTCFSL